MSQLIYTIGLLLALLACSAGAETILHQQRSLYNNIVVKKKSSIVCLQFSLRRLHHNQSCIDTRSPKEMVFSYTRMTMAALLFNPRPERILVVGLGGGTIPTTFRELFPEAQQDTLEIDPAVVELANLYFSFKADETLRVHVADARVWIRRAGIRKEQYDIIVLDAFNGEYIPEHLMTQEFFSEVQSILAPGGVLVANTFSTSRLYDHESETYKKVFGDFINFTLPETPNRVVIVPKENVSDDLIEQRVALLSDGLKPYNVPLKRYARIIKRQRNRKPDWNVDARVLTDQYSPANLLNNR